NRSVDGACIQSGQRLGLDAVPSANLLPNVGIAKVREVGVIDLKVLAARRRQVADLLRVHSGQVGKELLDLRVGARVDGLPAAAKMQNGGRRNRQLRGR